MYKKIIYLQLRTIDTVQAEKSFNISNWTSTKQIISIKHILLTQTSPQVKQQSWIQSRNYTFWLSWCHLWKL